MIRPAPRSVALALCTASASFARAQQASPPDSLLVSTNLLAAESAYYAASRARPHDPEARRELGRYLAQRGALRVGAVLIEEARTFGGDATTIARDLVPLYRALDDYRALSTLLASPLGEGERQQAVWLVAHAPALAGTGTTDSVTLSYRAPGDLGTLGRVVLKVGGRAVEAVIDPTRRGITLDPRAAAARNLHRFAARADGAVPAVADSVQIGGLTMVNAPVFVAPLADRVDAYLGIDVLQRFAATFDPRVGRLTLHVTGVVPAAAPGVRIPTLTSASDVRVVQGGRLLPITAPSVVTLLRSKRWTLDTKRGAIVVES